MAGGEALERVELFDPMPVLNPVRAHRVQGAGVENEGSAADVEGLAGLRRRLAPFDAYETPVTGCFWRSRVAGA